MDHPDSQHLDRRNWAFLFKPLMLTRTLSAGVLMGLANLVPGVSGGTMVLVMGLYDEFVSSVAEVTRLRINRNNVAFLILLVGAAGVALVSLAGTMQRLVTSHRSVMYALFVGLTLGGAPLLFRMLRPLQAKSVTTIVLGFLAMCLLAASHEKPATSQDFVIQANYVLDFVAGILGMAAMVLPGVSGAYMLLVVGRYEPIYAAIDAIKDGVDPVCLKVLIPVALGAIVSMVVLSNLLKWLLHHHPKPTLGFLLGILLGSVVGIPPFGLQSSAGEVARGLMLIAAGFAVTWTLSFMSPDRSS